MDFVCFKLRQSVSNVQQKGRNCWELRQQETMLLLKFISFAVIMDVLSRNWKRRGRETAEPGETNTEGGVIVMMKGVWNKEEATTNTQTIAEWGINLSVHTQLQLSNSFSRLLCAGEIYEASVMSLMRTRRTEWLVHTALHHLTQIIACLLHVVRMPQPKSIRQYRSKA